jgi:hypothetical protein
MVDAVDGRRNGSFVIVSAENVGRSRYLLGPIDEYRKDCLARESNHKA